MRSRAALAESELSTFVPALLTETVFFLRGWLLCATQHQATPPSPTLWTPKMMWAVCRWGFVALKVLENFLEALRQDPLSLHLFVLKMLRNLWRIQKWVKNTEKT